MSNISLSRVPAYRDEKVCCSFLSSCFQFPRLFPISTATACCSRRETMISLSINVPFDIANVLSIAIAVISNVGATYSLVEDITSVLRLGKIKLVNTGRENRIPPFQVELHPTRRM